MDRKQKLLVGVLLVGFVLIVVLIGALLLVFSRNIPQLSEVTVSPSVSYNVQQVVSYTIKPKETKSDSILFNNAYALEYISEDVCGNDVGVEVYRQDKNSIYVVNRALVGTENFETLLGKAKSPTGRAYPIYPFCGGAGHVSIKLPTLPVSLEDKTVKVYLGGYQYVPAIWESAGITVNLISNNSNYIVQENLYFSPFKFSDIKDIGNCLYRNIDPISYASTPEDLLVIGCVTKLIENDQSAIENIMNEVVEFSEYNNVTFGD